MAKTLAFFWRQNRGSVLLLAFVVLVIILGHSIPDPSLAYVVSPGNTNLYWWSLFVTGLPVWLQITLAAELLLLLFRQLRSTALNQGGHANPFHRCVIIATLLWTFFAAWHGWSEVRSQYLDIVESPMTWPVVSAIVSVSGIALAILVGMLLDRRWPGYGFWLVYLINYGLAVPREITTTIQRLGQLHADYRQCAFVLGVALAPLLAAVASTELSSASGRDNRSQLFLWTLSSSATIWLAVLLALASFPSYPLVIWIKAFILVLFGLTIFFAYLQLNMRLVHIVLLLAGLFTSYYLLVLGFNLPFLSGPDMLILAWIATRLRQAWRVAQRQETA